MRSFASLLRIVLGLIFVIFGLNGFYPFVPVPEMSPEATTLIKAFIDSGYLMKFIKGVEVIAGALLLLNVFVPVALVVIGPVVINIFLFHLFLDIKNIIPATVVLGLWLALMILYRRCWNGLLKFRV